MKKKNNINKNFIHENQKSFFFNDFLETNQKNKKLNKSNIDEDRLYVLFSFFFSLILIFSLVGSSIVFELINFFLLGSKSISEKLGIS